ncbi:aquaporin-11 [Scleropages formosus]|uniref:Aquaporin n=2 Tax=Scleropages formosus TaxID=113540 RepID=A0A8C9W9I0_SCLFO|nr:aquaporin-11 [Scleropages formosus]
MGDLSVSLALLGVVVLLCELLRAATTRLFGGTRIGEYVAESVSTFQLCACTHELKLLGDAGRVAPRVALTLTYLAAAVHGATFRGAAGNPCGALARTCHGSLPGAAARVTCQFAAAAAARSALPFVWALGLSDLHRGHALLGFGCVSPVGSALLRGAAVELGCAFTMQTALAHLQAVEERYRIHATALLVTVLVYAGGSVTGAVFNPALAFSVLFSCSGNTFLELCFVYWLGPLLGTAASLLLLDVVVPQLSGTKDHVHGPRRKSQ